MDDTAWMQLAIEEALKAQALGEVPVGAVLVHDNKLIAKAGNNPISGHDPSGHAEMNVLRLAGQKLNNYRLLDTTLYVTLEPCMMCAGLLVHARIKRLVFGAYDPKAGAVESIANLLEHPKLNHKVEVLGGIEQEKCGKILKAFFANLRCTEKQLREDNENKLFC